MTTLDFSIGRSLLVGCSVALLLAACATGPNVRTNVDPSVNFAQYKTFGFANPLGTDRSGYRSLVSQELMSATQREMELRGMRRVDTSPELLVNFNAKLSQQLQVMPAMAPPIMGGYYGYRAGFYGAWPMYDQSTVSQYTEGTLNIDVVDAAKKQLVWEGVVTDTVTQSDMNAAQAGLNAAVKAAFAKYPVPAPATK
jgi:hypothetical protein